MRHLNLLTLLLGIAAAFTLNSCGLEETPPAKPNILWIYLEDTSPLLGSYGTHLIATPHIDTLAQRGVVCTNAFMPAPVCSASRSSIITGMMSTTLGLHNHHSSRTEASAIYLPDSIQTLPELFKQAGYFTFNNGKDDYNFSYDRRDLYDQGVLYHPLYGKKGENIPLSSLKGKTPFFGQIQLSGGKEIFSSHFKKDVNAPVDRATIKLPPYLPDHPAMVEEYANHLDAIQVTDRKVGDIIKELSDNGLLENTIVFFFSDHGMRLTRHKQFLYDGGLHVPLIIADYSHAHGIEAGSRDDKLINGIDLGPTALALAGIPLPAYMEGRDIFDDALAPREYVIATRDRCDFTIDRIRAVRSKSFKYIRNLKTDRPYMQPTYMDVDSVEFVQVMRQLYAENKLDSIQARFFSKARPGEELYDLREDPFEINNLAGDPDYAEVLETYAAVLDQWMVDTDDKGQYPEDPEGLKLMLGIWGKYAINPEYDALREEYPDLEGSLWALKSEPWKKITGE